MEIVRGRKLPGNELILSDSFQVTLTEKELTVDELTLPFKLQIRVLEWKAEWALFAQMAVAGILGLQEEEGMGSRLKQVKEELEVSIVAHRNAAK